MHVYIYTCIHVAVFSVTFQVFIIVLPVVLTLKVICSEGNAGYYEVGCMSTPLDAGYSVLGWNHPGFWGSTVGVSKFRDLFLAFRFLFHTRQNFYLPLH